MLMKGQGMTWSSQDGLGERKNILTMHSRDARSKATVMKPIGC